MKSELTKVKVAFAFHCICGCAWTGNVPSMGAFNDLAGQWARKHTGHGHEACTAKVATAARKKLEKLPSDGMPRVLKMTVG